MVETISFPPNLRPMSRQIGMPPSLSTHYSKLSNLFFVSWEDAISLIGKLQVERETEVTQGFLLNPAENKDKLSIFPQFGKQGNLFCNFEDICASDSAFFASAIIKTIPMGFPGLEPSGFGSSGIGVVLKITKDSVQYQPIINYVNIKQSKIESFVPFEVDVKGLKSNYLLVMMDDGSLQVNQIHLSEIPSSQEGAKEISASANILTEINQLASPQEIDENKTIKGTIVYDDLIGARDKVSLADYMEKSRILDLSNFQCEDQMAKLTEPIQFGSKHPGQSFTAYSFPLHKDPLNVSTD